MKALFLLAFVAVILTYRDYGPNWDEAVQARYGELVIDYFASGFKDPRSNQFLDLRFYGPLVEIIPAMVYQQTGEDKYETRHLFLALIGLTAIPALMRYGRLSRTPWLAGLSVLALVTMPRFYGDWFTNSKDIPFAVLVIWFMATAVSLFLRRRFAWREIFSCALIFGLTLAVRPGSFLLLTAYFLGVGALSYLCAGQKPRRILKLGAAQLAIRTIVLFVTAWIIMVIPWPWAHRHPIGNPIAAIRVASSFPMAYPLLFEGKVISSDALPRFYLAKYLLITTPPVIMFFVMIGIATGLAAARKTGPQSFVFLTALFWFLAPFLYFILFHPNAYDGIRHFLFLLPAVSILAAYGAVWICHQAPNQPYRTILLVICAGLFLLPVRDLVALHPYQTTYFNLFAGGLAGADGQYDTDYWLTSYREAIQWVNQQASRHKDRPITVEIAGDEYIAPWVRYYAAQNVHPIVISPLPAATLPDGVDYFIAATRFGFHRGYEKAPIVHTIGRQGAIFTVIKAH